MLVHRTWFTDRLEPYPSRSALHETYKQWREGWFLFGVLPLYIRDYRG